MKAEVELICPECDRVDSLEGISHGPGLRCTGCDAIVGGREVKEMAITLPIYGYFFKAVVPIKEVD